jgi:predicted rRNA methylase YqxC with S4 and FtsJ domains
LKNILHFDDDFDGVLKSELEVKKIVDFLYKEIEFIGLKTYNISESNIRGSKGNLEFLFYIGI